MQRKSWWAGPGCRTGSGRCWGGWSSCGPDGRSDSHPRWMLAVLLSTKSWPAPPAGYTRVWTLTWAAAKHLRWCPAHNQRSGRPDWTPHWPTGGWSYLGSEAFRLFTFEKSSHHKRHTFKHWHNLYGEFEFFLVTAWGFNQKLWFNMLRWDDIWTTALTELADDAVSLATRCQIHL